MFMFKTNLFSFSPFPVNFLQMVSLAGGLPLQWPQAMQVMFDFFATLSSAGTTLMIPDCEFAYLQTSYVFYNKQIVYTFSVPIIIAVCILVWGVITCCCQKCCKFSFSTIKDYTILSIVLMLFLFYPTLVKLTLSMLKCPSIGTGNERRMFLMADLQEPCFTGRHEAYMFLLTIPQLVCYVLGLPLIAAILIFRNKKHLYETSFSTRYSLLYIGYRKDREWWELVVALRKIAVVSIGTFGIVMGVVDLQAFVALGIVFLSIVTHLIGQPFDTSNEKGLRLHNMEFIALCVCWFTFWGGLLYFLGHEKPGSIPSWVKISITIILMATNIYFC